MASKQLQQLQKWRDAAKWEKQQSVTQPASEITRHTYKQGLCCLRYFPELWYEFAVEELSAEIQKQHCVLHGQVCLLKAGSSEDAALAWVILRVEADHCYYPCSRLFLERLARPKEATAI